MKTPGPPYTLSLRLPTLEPLRSTKRIRGSFPHCFSFASATVSILLIPKQRGTHNCELETNSSSFFWDCLVFNFVKHYLIASETGMGLSKHLYAILTATAHIDGLDWILYLWIRALCVTKHGEPRRRLGLVNTGWPVGKNSEFCFPETLNIEVEGKQNLLFPLGLSLSVLFYFSTQK